MNKVSLAGKISRVQGLKYSPSGMPSCEFKLAVQQKLLDKPSMGYFEVMVFGEMAENWVQILKIGKEISVQGQLWGRTYKNRKGNQISETKVLAEMLEWVTREESHESH